MNDNPNKIVAAITLSESIEQGNNLRFQKACKTSIFLEFEKVFFSHKLSNVTEFIATTMKMCRCHARKDCA
jgi:hypothetical protein